MLGFLKPPAAPGVSLSQTSRLMVEELEPRALLSTIYTPAQILHAYSFDQVHMANGLNGTGQTIAIVDAYDDPNIAGDLRYFDNYFGLPAANFSKATPEGKPATDSGWASEIALDVEWAHVVAPGAKILLVEAATDSFADLLHAVTWAANQHGVSVVSMSWGSSEFSQEVQSAYDGTFTGHTGVTFVASAGDVGASPTWPAVSPYVLGVGGTTLTLNGSTWVKETGWGNGSRSSSDGGSGGGISQFEARPAYQSGMPSFQTGRQLKRTSPDVAYNADPNTGYYIYDSFNGAWFTTAGTSAGAPQWAGLIAIADQGRALENKAPLSSADTLNDIYHLPATDFHDITQGNNGYAARSGYDLVTGRGSPIANRVIADLDAAPGALLRAPAKPTTSSTKTTATAKHQDVAAPSALPDAASLNVRTSTTRPASNPAAQAAVPGARVQPVSLELVSGQTTRRPAAALPEHYLAEEFGQRQQSATVATSAQAPGAGSSEAKPGAASLPAGNAAYLTEEGASGGASTREDHMEEARPLNLILGVAAFALGGAGVRNEEQKRRPRG